MVEVWEDRGLGAPAQVIVAGWAMENMKARDYCYATAPLVSLPQDRADFLVGMVEAAELFAAALRGALTPLLAEGEGREAAREVFYINTQSAFEGWVEKLTAVNLSDAAHGWLADMEHAAMAQFNALALPGLADRTVPEQQAIIAAHRGLAFAFKGYGKLGGKAYAALNLPVPAKGKQEVAA